MNLSGYFLLHRADEDNSRSESFSETAYKSGAAVLVNLDRAAGIEPLSTRRARPACVNFGDCELLVWETVEEIDAMIRDRRLEIMAGERVR